jgi:hypothetical protein
MRPAGAAAMPDWFGFLLPWAWSPAAIESLRTWLDLVAKAVVVIGVPVGVVRYFFATRRERLDREYGTYDALDEKYAEFAKWCMDYPSLNLFEIEFQPTEALSREDRQKRLIGFSILIQIFERAYLVYEDAGRGTKKRRWENGWKKFIARYAERSDFVDAWMVLGDEWDEGFENFMMTETGLRQRLEQRRRARSCQGVARAALPA